jgi:uncharacterized protein (DUF779 family)
MAQTPEIIQRQNGGLTDASPPPSYPRSATYLGEQTCQTIPNCVTIFYC